MKIEANWEVGGDDVLHKFHISRLARPNDKQTNCAREWLMNLPYRANEVKIFTSREKAQAVCDKMNAQYRKLAVMI